MPANREKAQEALEKLKAVILEELRSNPDGLSNADLVQRLGLESDFEGENRNYLTWSVLGILIGERKVRYSGRGHTRRYHVVAPGEI